MVTKIKVDMLRSKDELFFTAQLSKCRGGKSFDSLFRATKG